MGLNEAKEIHEIKSEVSSIQKTLAKIEQVIEIVIVELRDRIKSLENSTDQVQEMLYTTCDTKSKEIDREITRAIARSESVYDDKLKSVIKTSDNRTYLAFSLISGLFVLFIGAVVYFNAQIGELHEKINGDTKERIEATSAALSTLKAMHEEIKYIRKKVDDHDKGHQ